MAAGTHPRNGLFALAVLAAGLASGCDDEAREAPASTNVQRPEPRSPSPETHEGAREEPAHDNAEAPAVGLPAAPHDGCAFGDPVRVWSRAAWVDVAATRGSSFLLAGSAPAGEGEEAFVLRLSPPRSVSTVARAQLEHPVPTAHRQAAPALSVAGTDAALALVDGTRALRVARFPASGHGADLPFAEVARGASLRFSPALSSVGSGWVVAWTDATGESMRVRARRVGERSPPRDLTPAAGGGAAPSFVLGAHPPLLVFIDARAGMSVAHRVPVGPDGFGETAVARPIGLVAEPPETVAVRIGRTDYLGYTAVGNVATAAVGLVPLSGTASPVPLVPGTGYGTLHVDAALAPPGAIFVADAPQSSAPDSPRKLHVRPVGADGPRGTAVIRGPSGAASRGRIARSAGGVVAVSFVEGDAVYVAFGRCGRS